MWGDDDYCITIIILFLYRNSLHSNRCVYFAKYYTGVQDVLESFENKLLDLYKINCKVYFKLTFFFKYVDGTCHVDSS